MGTLAFPILTEIWFLFITVVVFYAACKMYGNYKTGVFLAGVLLWIAPVENYAVLEGTYTYYGNSGLLFPNYPGYLLWVGVVPLWVILGWFVLAMSGRFLFHERFFSKRRAAIQALASGLFALNIDFMIDPIASSNGLWTWTSEGISILQVPLFNFVGWFLLIFLFDLIAEHTIFNTKPVALLDSLQRLIFGSHLNFSRGGINLGYFLFRIALLEVLVAVILTILGLI